MYKIYPDVKRLSTQDNYFNVKDNYLIFFETKLVNVFRKLQTFLNFEVGQTNDADIVYLLDRDLGEEGYKIEILDNKILVTSSTENGAYYATLTLMQIFKQTKDNIKCLVIEDEPDLKVRGLMLDISRDKVPTLDTVKKVIDMMSDIKMNHLELYVEGFSYGYPSFTKYLEEDGFISPEEYKEIEKYSNDRYIDLVPNQNGFGHMTKWLELDEFKDLAEIKEGIFLWGRHRKASTLNPLDDRSLELVKKMYKDMLPISNSKYFNMNFDEPFELGKGKSKEACEKEGLGNVYIDYVLKVYEEIKKYNKTPMIWGDVLIKHPELLYRLPTDMIFIDWGYDANYPFSKHLKKLKELGIKFIAAPGTTSWCSFAGRTNDWWENIANACIYTKEYEGEGVIVTDWGDFGHLQFLPISYAPLIYTGLMTWRVKEGTYFTLRDYLNKEIFNDDNEIIAEAMLDLGNYYRYLNEYRSNGTTSFHTFMWACYAMSEEDPYQYYKERTKSITLSLDKYNVLHKFLNLKIEEIELSKMNCKDKDVIQDELLQTIFILKLIHKVNIAFNDDIDIEVRVKFLEEVVASKDKLYSEQKRLWLSRNKSGGFDSSLSYLEKFVQFAEKILNYYNYIRRGEENEAQI